MKKFYILLFVSIICCFTSCLDNVTSDYTPEIYTSFLIKNSQDTLGVTYNTETSHTSLDTIFVGDTVRFMVAFDALGNTLKSAKIIWDSTYMDLDVILENSGKELTDAILDTIAAENGIIDFVPEYLRAVALPVSYVATKSGNPTITFSVESTSKYSPVTKLLYCPIADRPDVIIPTDETK